MAGSVCYWNGFVIGTDADQRRLLRLIRDRWLTPGGRAIIDVANPLVWAGRAGDVSHRAARRAWPSRAWPAHPSVLNKYVAVLL